MENGNSVVSQFIFTEGKMGIKELKLQQKGVRHQEGSFLTLEMSGGKK